MFKLPRIPRRAAELQPQTLKKKSLLANKLAHRRAARDLFFYVHAQVHHRSGSCSCAPRGFTVFLITLQHVNAPLPRLQRLTSLLVSMLLTGFDFGSCPGWSACERHPVYSLWRRASQNVSVRSLFAHGRVKRCPPPTRCPSCLSLQKWPVGTSPCCSTAPWSRPSTGKGTEAHLGRRRLIRNDCVSFWQHVWKC